MSIDKTEQAGGFLSGEEGMAASILDREATMLADSVEEILRDHHPAVIEWALALCIARSGEGAEAKVERIAKAVEMLADEGGQNDE